MKVAVSTQDGITLTPDHFGEGEEFLIFEVRKDGYQLLERRKNTSPEEEKHGSKEKAKGIVSILWDVPVLLGYQFGPNIMRIKNIFLPVVSRERRIEKALKLLLENYDLVDKELSGERGKVIILSDKGGNIIKLKDSKIENMDL